MPLVFLLTVSYSAFSCHLCGRRFGVQSNCNRHIRRCAIRGELFIARRLEFEAVQAGKSCSAATENSAQTPPLTESRTPSPHPSPKPKRPRRKRSPVRAWIPQSLASFTITTSCAPAPVPLPPVRPRTEHEERDSYILCHDQPYTEQGWNGRCMSEHISAESRSLMACCSTRAGADLQFKDSISAKYCTRV